MMVQKRSRLHQIGGRMSVRFVALARTKPSCSSCRCSDVSLRCERTQCVASCTCDVGWQPPVRGAAGLQGIGLQPLVLWCVELQACRA